ncbi:MAG TPA: rod shape-determining protein MreC [bacterium]|uniref:Cell shape-determining protein MreC n=1 Tax=candidate division TA06 bacterium ADurb.Bin417 TaxID=1852828 RepID=A0A1V5MGC3_UNCT6|nr:MAG: Cell shape-determining protein MreC precursor [candidate division TA06 bacterium ADurb.Bin417]HNQ35296.1 rod shape-determining protein MreC [bacterium]HNS48618.1 rod shape-determining protein MreC [bacterium]
MLWRFQKEILLVVFLLISFTLTNLKISGGRTGDRTFLKLEEYHLQFEQEVLRENQRLRRLLGMKERRANRILAIGGVVGIDPMGSPSWLLAEVGNPEALRPDLAALDGRGNLVGRVVEIKGRTLRVMTILNPQSRVSVVLQESRNLGVLESGEAGSLKINYIPREATVLEKEAVMTSQLSHNFPAGIPIGRVQRIAKKGFFTEVTVLPNANFSTLEEVAFAH